MELAGLMLDIVPQNFANICISDLLPLMATRNIIDVSVQHIKYRVDFYKIGFYPKIWIKRHGEWEPEVVRKSKSVR